MPVPAFTPAASTITVGELLDRWLDEAVALTVRPGTLASYRYVVRVHLRPALGDVPLASTEVTLGNWYMPSYGAGWSWFQLCMPS